MPRSKPTGLLAAFAETKKAPTVLLGDIQSHAVKRAQEDDRATHIIHPSEMAKSDWCPRATLYRVAGEPATDEGEVFRARMLTIFQEGHDIHSKFQTWLAQMERLYGWWRCPSCGKELWGTAPMWCQQCGIPMQYREVPLKSEEQLLIEGHADGAVLDSKVLIEIKSIGLGTVRMEEPSLVSKHTVKTEAGKKIVDYDGLWRSIKHPLLSHRKQAGIYLFLAQQQGIDVDRMVFIYENKANQDVKEFVIKYDHQLIDPLLETAADIVWAKKRGETLPRPPEFTRNKKPCTVCPWRSLCWGKENDEQDRDQERDPSDGAASPGGEEGTGDAADLPADETGPRLPRTAGRPHRRGRFRTDAPVRSADEVGRVSERPTGDGRGRRTVRRVRTGEGPGDQGLRLP